MKREEELTVSVKAALRAYAEASKGKKCPICAGTESCDHTVKERLSASLATPKPEATEGELDEMYQIGHRDGYEKAVQDIDQRTGGDGEYRYCTDHDPDRHTPDAAAMIQRIVDRFEVLNLLDDATKTGRDQEWGLSSPEATEGGAHEKGWQPMETAPRDGTEFIALERCHEGRVYARVYKWEGPPNYWNAKREGVCIRPEYQDRYVWTSLPRAALTAKQTDGREGE